MTLVAAIFLCLFGAVGAWVVIVRYPKAHFTRAAYIFMTLGGLAFIGWYFSHWIGVAIGAMILLFIGGSAGVIGAFRREVRLAPPA